MVLGLRYIFGMADILKVAYDRPLYVGADKSLREALEGQGMNGVRAVNHALEMTEDSLSFSAM
jgi:TfoX/Sxy family transcriptional regulator of competence genes